MPREMVRKFSHIRPEKKPMRQLAIEIAAALALTIAAIVALAAGAHAGDLSVTHAFARASATPVAKSAAAYVTIVNGGDAEDSLVAVTTPAARSAMLHRTEMSGDVMKMEPVDTLAIPPHGTIAMGPAGTHVMLMGLKAPLKEGETLQLTLTFDKAEPLTVDVPVHGVAANN
jgi:copper(I)-binding protein